MNKTQKVVISVAVPIIIVLVGFVVIGASGSTDTPGFLRLPHENEGGITFNPIGYFAEHGIEWSIVTLIITGFEYFWWRTPKKKNR